MPARPLVARPLVAAAVLLTVGAGSVLVSGTSAADGPAVSAPAVVAAPVAFGPVAVRPALLRPAVLRPAVLPRVAAGPVFAMRTSALPLAAAEPRLVVGPAVPPSRSPLQPVTLVAPGPPLGPATGSPPVGPPGVIGPDSPLPRVRAVQRLLNRAGARLRVDGAWGPATTRAVSAVQARAGLPVDGRVGPMTMAFLDAHPRRS